MRRHFFPILFSELLFITSCAMQEQASDKGSFANTDSIKSAAGEKPVPTGPLTSTLNAYYKVKDAFTRTDGTGADMAAMQLRLSIDSLNIQELKTDSSYNTSIDGSKQNMLSMIDGMIKERDMQQKRKHFAVLSGYLYGLVKASPYKGETVYRLHCPMAFDEGADWLSNQPIVANPYFGSKMMECGAVTDSLLGK